MKTQVHIDENIIMDGAATLQNKIEGIGGNLYLTNKRLIFEPHILNIHKNNVVFDLSELISVNIDWSKILNILPICPNAITITLKNGLKSRFLVFKRKNWASQINAVLKSTSHP